MRQEHVLSSLSHRLRRPGYLAVVLLVGCTFSGLRLLMAGAASGWQDGGWATLGWGDLLMPFLLPLANLALAPLPWQWTGDDALRPSPLRGILQAVAFNLLWVTLVLVLLHLGDSGRPMPPGPPPPPHGPGPRNPGPLLAFGLLNLTFSIVVGWLMADREASATEEQRTAELLREAQAQALQSQLEPHVLYNALNSLSELVHEDPLAAEEVIIQLADLYRRLTRHGKARQAPLGEERKLVEAYLAMESMRLGERLTTTWSWPFWADSLMAPPLLLQPLVENAIKHGISPQDAGGEVVVACFQEGTDLVLQVRNTCGPAPSQAASEGIGLSNLRARLQLWTEVQADTTLEEKDGWMVASVRWCRRTA